MGVVSLVVLAFVTVAEFRLIDPADAAAHSIWAAILTVTLVLAVLWAVHIFAPSKLIWFTAIYPGLGFWLLWGGSVWLPVVALAGFVIGWLAFRAAQPFGGPAQLVAMLLVPVLWWIYGAGVAADVLNRIIPFSIEAVGSDKFGGFVLAITIGVAGIALSLPFGIVLALGRQSNMFLVKALSVCFIEFIRGVPLITLLFTASLLLNYFLPPGTNFDIILRVIIMVTLFAAAYIAEVIRGGLAALPRGQYEAADALGLDYWKAQRLIILPQALKISIPGIVSTFIGMFKDTTLVVFVGLLDPLKGITDIVRASTDWKGIYWEPYIFVAAIFFIFNFSMSRYAMYLERKLKTDHR
ncbi:amino acid ABC transporter permease [Aliigemmobacter aestuarii]|uniref:Amino acid ABC transporter permease n=2 Tax=Aliigemmobacter aestuarii TaxID=1445661 RepID=A0A4S3MTH3_9RHOB|nr:amino acid ABC transporter permease [Gemmobacter aestuarii]